MIDSESVYGRRGRLSLSRRHARYYEPSSSRGPRPPVQETGPGDRLARSGEGLRGSTVGRTGDNQPQTRSSRVSARSVRSAAVEPSRASESPESPAR